MEKALFEKISSYGKSFITLKIQAVDNEGNSVSLDGSVFKAQQCVEWYEALKRITDVYYAETYHDECFVAVGEELNLHCVLPERCPGRNADTLETSCSRFTVRRILFSETDVVCLPRPCGV